MPEQRSAADAATESEFESSGNRGDAETKSVDTRWRFTNDVLAGVLVVSLPLVIGLAGAGHLDLSHVPVEIRLAYLTAGGVATVWAFGVSALKAWAKVRGGGG